MKSDRSRIAAAMPTIRWVHVLLIMGLAIAVAGAWCATEPDGYGESDV